MSQSSNPINLSFLLKFLMLIVFGTKKFMPRKLVSVKRSPFTTKTSSVVKPYTFKHQNFVQCNKVTFDAVMPPYNGPDPIFSVQSYSKQGEGAFHMQHVSESQIFPSYFKFYNIFSKFEEDLQMRGWLARVLKISSNKKRIFLFRWQESSKRSSIVKKRFNRFFTLRFFRFFNVSSFFLLCKKNFSYLGAGSTYGMKRQSKYIAMLLRFLSSNSIRITKLLSFQIRVHPGLYKRYFPRTYMNINNFIFKKTQILYNPKCVASLKFVPICRKTSTKRRIVKPLFIDSDKKPASIVFNLEPIMEEPSFSIDD